MTTTVSSGPMRDLWRSGETAALLLAITVTGSVVLWVGVPVLTLWIASRVQAATDSLGAAVAVGMLCAPIAIALVWMLLGWLSDKHRAVRLARGYEDTGHFAVEVVVVVSAVVTLIGFTVWFVLFSASSPIPISGPQ